MPKKTINNTREIPMKNYYIAILIFIAIILGLLYILKWYNVKQTELYRESYLIKTDTLTYEIKNMNEISQVIIEAPDTYFAFIGYKNDKEEYLIEQDIKTIIDNYKLNDMFYYIDATEIKNDENYINNFNDIFKLEKDKINNIPAIIFFDKGTYKVIDKNIKTELKKLLELNGFEK